MKLLEALEAIKQNPASESPVLDIQLACGINPLHFSTFLHAHLRQSFPSQRISVNTGAFGDLPGNLERLGSIVNSSVVALVEWQDLDLRLGFRSLGGWSPRQFPEIIRTVRDQVARIAAALESLSKTNRVVVSLPTLPLPPISFAPGFIISRFEGNLSGILESFSSRLLEFPGIRLVNPRYIDQISPLSSRLDAKSDLIPASRIVLGTPTNLQISLPNFSRSSSQEGADHRSRRHLLAGYFGRGQPRRSQLGSRSSRTETWALSAVFEFIGRVRHVDCSCQ